MCIRDRDTETRHLPAAKAAKAVEELTRSAVENGVGCIYKKTDSALREMCIRDRL